MDRTATIVTAEYVAAKARVRLRSSRQSPQWMAIWSTCHQLSDDVQDFSILDLSIPAWVAFGLGDSLRLQAQSGLQFQPDEATIAILTRGLANRRELEGEQLHDLPDDIQETLQRAGFVRTLTPQQLRNVSRLYRFSAGADFSVPGAGKTSEALAYFALKRQTGDRLVVVAPPNAFAPWEEQVKDCFGESTLNVVRLTGSTPALVDTLSRNPDIALISYQKFSQPEALNLVAEYLAAPRSFLFLDESHKIKLGEGGAWGTAALSVAHIPQLKLVMSGTPLPNSEADLVAQMRFLHPEVYVDDGNVRRLIQPLFVRTSKAELGLPEVSRRLIEIDLRPGQRRLYEVLSTTLAREIVTALSRRERLSIRRLGKSVLRLLKFVSNPALLIPEIGASEAAQLREVLLDEDSAKIEYAVMRARQLAAQGRKSIIWSSFVDNVEVIAGRLADLGAEYIHGGVNVGSEDDDTRERRIAQFHKDASRFVLVANPAAAGEAISLHTVCHNAIYVDRTYNAAQFLQSEDRIHRVGLPAGTITEVEILIAPHTIDESVNRRLIQKVKIMSEVLNDPHLQIEHNYEDPDEDVAVDVAIADEDLEDFVQGIASQV